MRDSGIGRRSRGTGVGVFYEVAEPDRRFNVVTLCRFESYSRNQLLGSS